MPTKDFWEDPPMYDNPWEDPPIEYIPPVNVVGEPEPYPVPGPEPEPYHPDPSTMSPDDIISILQRGGSAAASLLRTLTSGGPSGGRNGTWLDNLLSFLNIGDLPGSTSGQADPAMLAASMAAAWNQYNDSDRYTRQAESYADRLDPFGSQRSFYQDRLRQLHTDPEGFLEKDPAYQSILRLGINPAASKMRARGYGNSGNMLSELTRLSGDITNKYIGDMETRLGNFGGAQFGPGAAGSILQAGMQGSINSRNAALGSLFAGLGYSRRNANNNPTTPPGTPPGGNPGTDPIVTDPNDPNFVGPPRPYPVPGPEPTPYHPDPYDDGAPGDKMRLPFQKDLGRLRPTRLGY